MPEAPGPPEGPPQPDSRRRPKASPGRPAVTIRILADREPYSSYIDNPSPDSPNHVAAGPRGFDVILNGPGGLDDPSPDVIAIPAEDFLVLPRLPDGAAVLGSAYIAYGPVSLMQAAFERGCSDYMREPWSLLELRSRAIRLGKRRFLVGEKSFELRDMRLIGPRAAVEIRENERALFSCLLRNAPLPVPRESAFSVLAPIGRAKTDALGRCVLSLRRKMETCEPGLGARLRAVRGLGYRLDVDACG
jgi:hypothetical protein